MDRSDGAGCDKGEKTENKEQSPDGFGRQQISASLLFDLNLNDHHTKPFNECVTTWIKDIILNNGNISTVLKDREYSLTLSNYRFIRSNMMPSDVHTFNNSYVGTIIVDIQEKVCTIKKKEDATEPDNECSRVLEDVTHRDVVLCEFPIMLYSIACHFSDGHDLSNQTEPEFAGGFIIKGKRRFIPLLKSLVNNYPFRFFNKNKKQYSIQVRSEHIDRRHRSTSTLELVLDDQTTKRSNVFHNVGVKIPFLTPLVPVTVLILAIGWSVSEFTAAVQVASGTLWDEKIFRKYFLMLRHDYRGCDTKEHALLYIGRLYGKASNTSLAEHVVKNEVLPHLNGFQHEKCKGFYLAYIYGLLILFKENVINETDRDSRMYTRLIDSGTSLAFLFRILFVTFVKQGLKIMRRALKQDKPIEVIKIYNSKRLTQKLTSALATGVWSTKRKGVSHSLITTNEQAIIAQLRRISSSHLNNGGKHIEPRMVHSSACGYECAAETPEGLVISVLLQKLCFIFFFYIFFTREACGLVYSLASLTRVTQESDAEGLMDYLLAYLHDIIIPFAKSDEEIKMEYYKIFDPHGRFIGWCRDIDLLNSVFLQARRNMNFDPFVTRFQDDLLKEWRVYCDIGRMVRPLLVMDNVYKIPQLLQNCASGTSVLPTLLANGCVEYVSPMEETTLRVTFTVPKTQDMFEKYTHMEISDVSFVGIIAALAPFFRHNQGPRLVYWIGMSKQAIGTSNRKDIGSATTHNLWYGQKPMVVTKTARDLNMDQIPDCANVFVVFLPHSANQEDAIVMNRASIDRGLFMSDSIRTYSVEKQGKYNDVSGDKFEKPILDQTFSLKDADYSKIQSNGVPRIGTNVNGGDIIIGKTVPIKKAPSSVVVNMPKSIRSTEYQQKRRDSSIQVRFDEAGTVDSTLLATTPYCEIAKVRVRSIRRPEVGDKFSSRHSQKYVVFICNVYFFFDIVWVCVCVCVWKGYNRENRGCRKLAIFYRNRNDTRYRTSPYPVVMRVLLFFWGGLQIV